MAQTGSSSENWMDDWTSGGSWYVGAKAGGNWLANDTHLVTNSLFPTPIGGSVSYKDGVTGAVQGGFAFGGGLHLEEEFAYRYNQVDRVSPYGAGRGSMRNYAAMTNVTYELPIDFPLRPYIGGGIGAADYAPYHLRGDGMPYPNYVGGPDSWGLAWQAIGGVAYSLDDHIDLTLEYRYFERINDHPVGVGNDYEAHSALVGVRYSFGEPAPAPMAPAAYAPPPASPPAPASPRNYLVFFNFNKSDLTSDARQIVDQAASNAKNDKVTRLEVTGYTDTVGSDAYNMRLSRRRAETVATELEAQGVSTNDIAIFAKGKHDLLVPTADGVREPQNRRVQIIYASGTTPSS
jgi:outer membrane protein OmpA-like peptidoglycan-associated protein